MDIRFRVILIVLVAAATVAVWTLPDWWVVVNPESSVAEGLPGMSVDLRVQFAALPNSIQNAYYTLYYGDEDEDMMAQPDWALALVEARFLTEDIPAPENDVPFEPPTGSSMVASGRFSSIDNIRQATGDLMIYQNAVGDRILRLDTNFRSSRAADMYLIFTRNPDPTNEEGVGVDFIEVGALHGTYGAQTYNVPSVVDFSRYPVLALYSKRYAAVLATATIR